MRALTILSVAFPFALVSTDPVGGAEQILAHIDRALNESGHRSIVLAAEGSVTSGELIAVPSIAGPIGWADWSRTHRFVRASIDRLVRDRSVDLVHLHGVDFYDYLPKSDVRVLATLHLPLPYYPIDVLDLKRPRTWLNTVSTSQHESVGTQPRIACLIENGVFSPDGEAQARQSFALAMGRICPEKGFHLALDAAKSANVPMKLAGSVGDFAEHKQYFAREIEPRLDGERQWIGPVSGALKWHLLRTARCVLIPSLVPETASLVAREALAAGTPVIAYPSGALCQIVEDGRTGFLVHDVEEMARALRRTGDIDPLVCRRIAQERYSAARMTQQYLELYQRLLETA